MKKWSDLWTTPKGLFVTILILLCVYGAFHLNEVGAFFDAIFIILVNKVLKIVIVIAIILWLLRVGKGK